MTTIEETALRASYEILLSVVNRMVRKILKRDPSDASSWTIEELESRIDELLKANPGV